MTSTADAFLITTRLECYEGADARPRARLDARDPAGRRMRTIPWSWYEDPEVARRERDRIFMRSWQYAGRAAELTAPGSYVATQVGGLPVVLTRDRDDTLRAFANVCRHRGAIVARGAGERGTLQCPYHAWTYGLDGCLRAAPRTRDDPGFDTEGLGLVPMAAGTWGPFVFVNPDAGAEPLEQALGDLPAVVAAHGLDVGALVFHHRVEYEIRANWKIALENYLECYHCQLNHPGLVSLIDDRRLALEADALRASQFNPVHPDHELPAGAIPRGQFHLFFPSMKFNAQPGLAEPLDRSGLAGRAGPLPRVPRLLLRAGRARGVDRGVPRLRRPGRGGGHRAGRGRPGGRGQRARAGGAAARARRAAHRALPALGARAAGGAPGALALSAAARVR